LAEGWALLTTQAQPLADADRRLQFSADIAENCKRKLARWQAPAASAGVKRSA